MFSDSSERSEVSLDTIVIIGIEKDEHIWTKLKISLTREIPVFTQNLNDLSKEIKVYKAADLNRYDIGQTRQ